MYDNIVEYNCSYNDENTLTIAYISNNRQTKESFDNRNF